MAAGAGDKTISLWDLKSYKCTRKLTGHTGWVNCVAFSPDGSRLASGATDNTVLLWDGHRGKELRRLAGHNDQVTALDFSPKGQVLATGGGDGRVRLWNSASGNLLETLDVEEAVAAVTFSRDGRFLAAAARSRLFVWEAQTLQPCATIEARDYVIRCVTFAPDAHSLAIGGQDGKVRLIDVATWSRFALLADHQDSVECLLFCPVGCHLLSGSSDCSVRLRDLAAEHAPLSLKLHRGSVTALAWVRPRVLASASEDRTIVLWEQLPLTC